MNLIAALLLWLSTMVLILANNAIGDTVIAGAGGPVMAELYEALVPLPYIALCAWIYARNTRTAEIGALLGVGLLWAISTVLVDALITRLALGQSWRLALVHYRFWDGYWFALVPLVQLVAPPLSGRLIARQRPAG
jgi:hypothetical protein